jgi:hypothetical protein
VIDECYLKMSSIYIRKCICRRRTAAVAATCQLYDPRPSDRVVLSWNVLGL